jgi:hypothetical protein
MTTIKTIGSVNAAGIEAFKQLIAETRKVAATTERRAGADAILANPDYIEAVEGAGTIDTSARFETSFDLVEHIYDAIAVLGPASLKNRGIVVFLYLTYIDQLVDRSARNVIAYILDTKDKGTIGVHRNYRNGVYAHLMLFHHYRHNARVCRALMRGKPNVLGNILEKIMQRPNIMAAEGSVELIVAMFVDPATGKNRRAPSKKSGGKNANKALSELSVIVFGQYARNYDISRMTGLEMLALVPATKGLAPYKKHAVKWFEEKRKEEAAAADVADDLMAA